MEPGVCLRRDAVNDGGKTEREGRAAFYERRWFQGAVAVVGLVGAVAALIGPPKLWDVIADLFSSEPPTSYTEIVLDSSTGMSAPFEEGATKLDAAVSAVETFVAPFENEGLALRVYGGNCDESGELVVDFGDDRADEVAGAAGELEPGGSANFANAVIAAIDDFANREQFPDSDVRRRVLILAGSDDGCRGDAAAEVCRELRRSGIDAVFKLVGVKVPQDDRSPLRDLDRECGRQAEVVFANNLEQLGAAVAPAGATGPTGPTGPMP
jgi:Ca-activated chloride channel homolog